MSAMRYFILLFLSCLMLPLSAIAGDDAPLLTLGEAVEMALRTHPDVRVALEQEEELKGKIKEVRSGAFPQLSLHGYGLRLRDPSILNSSSFDDVPEEFRKALIPKPNNMFDFGVKLTQPLYTAGKIGTALDLAKVSLEEKETHTLSVRRQLTFNVFQAFHALLLVEANRDVVLETKRLREEHLQQARSRFENGVATEVDVLRSEVNVANMEPEVIRAENRVRLARSTFNDLIGVDLEYPTRIAGTLEFREWQSDEMGHYQELALVQRPEIETLRQQLEEARLTLALARAENRLSIDMEGKAGYSVREPKNFFNNDFSRWSISVNFNLPLYDSGRKAGLMAQASARYRAAEQMLKKAENDCRLEVKQAYDAMQSEEKAITAAQLSVQQAERVLEMMESNYRFGAATTLEVMDSQNALSVARNARIAAIYEYEMAKATLKLVSGGEIVVQRD
jgi:outer membrane protein